MNAPTRGLSVLFDAYWLADGPPSGRNVLTSLISAWEQAFPSDTIALAVPDRVAAFQDNPDLARHTVVEIPRIKGMVHGIWVSLRLGPRSRDYDAVITQNFTPLMPRHTRTVRTTFVHDVIFTERPQWFTRKERLYLFGITVGARRADVILTSSKTEQRRIIRLWRALADRVHSVGLATPLSLRRAVPRRPSIEALPQNSRPFILAVGRLNVRKNIDRLIDAYSQSEQLQAEADLVVAGAADGRGTILGSGPLPDSVHFLGGVSDEELVWLYGNCRIFVFPSLDEGFGLPLLEARELGAIIAASDLEVFRELDCTDIYFDPESVSNIKETLESAFKRYPLNGGWVSASAPPEWGDVVTRIREAILGTNS